MIGHFPSGHYLPTKRSRTSFFGYWRRSHGRARVRFECLLPIKDLSNADWLNSISFDYRPGTSHLPLCRCVDRRLVEMLRDVDAEYGPDSELTTLELPEETIQ
jgi:hypothetical protein